MTGKKVIVFIAVLSMLFSLMSAAFMLPSIAAVTEAEVSSYNAAANGMPTGDTSAYYWTAEIISGTGKSGTVTKLQFRNKKTGLYLAEKDGKMIQTSDEDATGVTLSIQDNYGYLWKFFTVSSRYLGTDGNITTLGENKASSDDHRTDGIFNGEGYEMVHFSADGTKESTELTSGTAYMIYTFDNSQFATLLKGEDVAGETVTAEVSSYNAAANGMPTGDTSAYYWTAEIISGTGKSGTVTKLQFRNKKTGLYLAEKDGKLIQTSDKDATGATLSIQDNYGYLWKFFTVSSRYLGTDGNITTLGENKASSDDHRTDGIFNGEGYEMVHFSADGTKESTELTSGTDYMIYTFDNSQFATLLKGEDAAGETVTAEVSSYNAAANGMPTGDTSAYYWTAEIISGTGKTNGVTKLQFRNKKTGLYLAEVDGKLIQTSDNNATGATLSIQDNWGFLWMLFTANKLYLGTDGNITTLGENKVSSADHRTDGIFNAEGYEMVHFSADGTKESTELTSGTDYMIYTFDNSQFATLLKGEDAAGETVTAEVSSYNAAANGMPTGDTSAYYWTAEIISGTGKTNGVTKLQFRNKKTGLYLAEVDGKLIQTSDKNATGATLSIQDNWGYLWMLFTANKLYLGTDGNITTLGENKVSSADHRTDGIFNAEGYEMVHFSADGTKESTELTSGTAYMIYTIDNSQFATVLCGEKAAEEPPVTPPSPADPADAVAYQTKVLDVSKNAMPTEDKDAYLWTAFRQPEGTWVFQNVATGLVLSDNNGTLIAETFIGERFQEWKVEDNYGYLWKVYNRKTERYLSTDGELNRLGLSMATSGTDHETDGINNNEWYEMVHFSLNGTDEAMALVDGRSYYIYNLLVGGKPEFKQILGCTTAAAKPALPVVPDTIMDGQDTANAPIDISEPLNVFMTPLSSLAKRAPQIWIFRQVTLETPVNDIWDTTRNTSERPKITVGYTVQNKETGLYLTEIDHEVKQDIYKGTKEQIWVFENYPFGHEDLNIMRNYGSGWQLILEQSTLGLYDPVGYSVYEELRESWPSLVAMNGGPVSGVATVSLARVTTDVNDGQRIMPEDGKGYYLYCSGYGAGGSLLEAVSESVSDFTGNIPGIEKYPYCKRFTYLQDFAKDITTDNPNWDALFNAYVQNGALVGMPSDESGVYGIGFRHSTYGRGTSELSFTLKIPEYTEEYVAIALRLNDYYDVASEQTGLRLYVNKDGRIALKFAGTSDTLTYRETGYSFENARQVLVSDDADRNVITLSFADDNGKLQKVADFTVADGTVTMDPVSGERVTKFYGYNIYRDGYMSVTTAGYDVELTDMKLVLPVYSMVPFTVTEQENPDGPHTPDTPKDPENPGDNKSPVTGVAFSFMSVAVLLMATAIVLLTFQQRKKENAQTDETVK